MSRRIGRSAAVSIVAPVLAVGIGSGLAMHGDDDEASVTGPQADAATAAALKAAGGGTVAEVERDAENGSTWEVEVTRRDGTTVEVRLDDSYRPMTIEKDDEGQ